MLDVVYHVSFLTEEARQLAAVVAYVDPQLSQESGRIRNLWHAPAAALIAGAGHSRTVLLGLI